MTDSPRTNKKLDILLQCFDELAITNGVFQVTPEMQDLALRRLDSMLAEWEAQGIALGYAYPVTYGGSLPSDDSGIQDAALNAVATCLAVRVAPTIGKSISSETRLAAKRGEMFLRAQTAVIPSMSLPSRTPMGQGNRYWIGAYPPVDTAESAL